MKNALLLLILMLSVMSCNDNNRKDILLKELEQLKITNEHLQTEVFKSKKQRDSLIEYIDQKTKNYWFDDQYDGEELVKNEISKPEEFIITSLKNAPELIPLKAVLGGTMAYSNIQVLGNKWVIADYNDGHIEGKSIYEYKVNNEQRITFKIMDTTRI